MVTTFTPADTPDEYVFTCDLDRRAGMSPSDSAAISVYTDRDHIVFTHTEQAEGFGRTVYLAYPDAVNLADLLHKLTGTDREPEPPARSHDFTAALLITWCALIAVAAFMVT